MFEGVGVGEKVWEGWGFLLLSGFWGGGFGVEVVWYGLWAGGDG